MKHSDIDRLIVLDKKYTDTLSILQAVYDGCLRPLYTVVFWLLLWFAPSILCWFGISCNVGWMTYLTSLSALFAATKCWREVDEYFNLHLQLSLWKVITNFYKGPFISGHSLSDVRYTWHVYADAARRITPVFQTSP